MWQTVISEATMSAFPLSVGARRRITTVASWGLGNLLAITQPMQDGLVGSI